MSSARLEPLCVVGDVHLSGSVRQPVGEALAELVARHPESEIVLNGDTFDLSTDPPELAPAQGLARILAANAAARDALRTHLAAGGRVALIAGNHDAAITTPEVSEVLRRELGEPLEIARWFVRRGTIHIEHGHVYDPDNAPVHPLADWSVATEPLGVALTRRFVARAGVWEFAHGEETTPLAGLLRTFRLYGARAPLKVLQYYSTAATLTWQAGHQPGLEAQRSTGAHAIAELARQSGVDADALHTLAVASRAATHLTRGGTFQRLYLDRSLASVVVLAALGLAAWGSPAAAGAAALGTTYLGWSISRGTNRYRGLLEERLGDAAAVIRELTFAQQVVLGHSHRVAQAAGYLNPGSFAFPAGPRRRFVRVDPTGAASLVEL